MVPIVVLRISGSNRLRIEVIRIELGFIPQARADRQSRQGAPLILDVDSEFVNREIQSACSGELLIRTGISREQCIDFENSGTRI